MNEGRVVVMTVCIKLEYGYALQKRGRTQASIFEARTRGPVDNLPKVALAFGLIASR